MTPDMAAPEQADSERPKAKEKALLSLREGKLADFRKTALAFHKELCELMYSLVEGRSFNKREAAMMRKVSNLLVLCVREAATGEATVRMLRGNNLIKELDGIDRASTAEAKTDAKLNQKKKNKGAKAKAKQQRRVDRASDILDN